MSQDSVSQSLTEQQNNLQKNTHKAMFFLSTLGTLLLYQFRSIGEIKPFLAISALLWFNAILLIKGLRGVLEGRNSKIALIGLQMIFVFTGIALITQNFKGHHIPLILGSTTWIIALFWASTQRNFEYET